MMTSFYYETNVGIAIGNTYSLAAHFNDRISTLESFDLDSVGVSFPRCSFFSSDNGQKISSLQDVTESFLKKAIIEICNRYNIKKIEYLYISIPEMWIRHKNQTDYILALYSFFSRLSYIKKVHVVSESVAASAFFAYNFEQIKKRKFFGKILLVDYSGGAPNITVTSVSTVKENPNLMEISMEERNEIEENAESETDSACFRYLKAVVRLALESEGLKLTESQEKNELIKAVYDLEKLFFEKSSIIAKQFERKFDVRYNKARKIMMGNGTENDKFCDISFGTSSITVTYGYLIDAYNCVVTPVLKEALDDICKKMETGKISYEDRGNERFKIATIGRFGNFWLVKKQVENYFHIGTADLRTKNILTDQNDMEKASVCGAALLADRKILLGKRARFSLGIFSGNREVYYAFQIGEPIQCNVKYFVHYADKNKVVFQIDKAYGINQLLINRTYDDAYVQRLEMKSDKLSEIIEKLKCVTVDTDYYHIAFSIDESDLYTIYFVPYDLFSGKANSEQTIEIGLGQ